MSTSQFIVIWARPFSLDSPIVDRKQDLSRFIVEKDRTAVADVSGNVTNILNKVFISRKTNGSHCFGASIAFVGFSASLTEAHLIFHLSNFPLTAIIAPMSLC